MSTLKIDTILHSSGSTTTEPSIPALDQRMAKAWVNFNGVGTVAVRDSYNVSSVTDNGTGAYAVNYAVAMDNANYSAVSCCGNGASSAFTNRNSGVNSRTVSLANVSVWTISSNTASDLDQISFQVLGGQA